MQPCSHHPERPALALCMACGKAICQECSTLWQGIHYCAPCLEERRGSARQRGSVLGWLGIGVVTLGLFLLASALRIFVGTIFGSWF